MILGYARVSTADHSLKEPCFYEKKGFFIRTHPSTRKLEGNEVVTYINQRKELFDNIKKKNSDD